MKALVTITILMMLLPDTAQSAKEYATFEAFYQESAGVSWVLAALAALIAGAFIYFSGGTASPLVISIGTWIGQTMGLSGIVATKAGLALLGAGSIASGGFGVIGGTAVLTAALTFSTELIFDYSLSSAVNEYQYNKLQEHSQQMPTLPLPLNGSGPSQYRKALRLLDEIDDDLPIFSPYNKVIINDATELLRMLPYKSKKSGKTTYPLLILTPVTAVRFLGRESSSPERLIKTISLLSLLEFVSNDYVEAKEYANAAIKMARKSEIRRTLPAFIYATSVLYDENPHFIKNHKNFFNYAILAEPDNPLIPLLFSLYLDRLLLRIDDGTLDERSLFKVFETMRDPSVRDFQIPNYTIMLSRYLMRLKLEQQKIASLSTSMNSTIKNSKRTLEVLEDSLKSYEILLKDGDIVLKELLATKYLWTDDEAFSEAWNMGDLMINYVVDKRRLNDLVENLRTFQNQSRR
ncbi:hypothetical protein [Thiorhodovibrio frisius]|uniref:Uncharacterized protein n=1 Tax=Thiorhodovibrio frisius TaxID=631362 RepID=H8Z1B5_9GAMM|nr:hypothetical protein [Thiorhodovibrio frisius]EIC21430.1 hypothetical protein Thi970DRAFT_01638 [Thiorhodovibrio frisius]WPL24016.1 hypothetical protein Thiofri_04227 [Thiorhodovibrio frisius]